MVFSSEGATIKILKNLIKSIDGEPYAFIEPSAEEYKPSKTATAPVVTVGKPKEKREIPVVFFRHLPDPDIPAGTTAGMVSDSMRLSSDWKSRSRAARLFGAMGQWGVSAIPAAVKLLSDTSQCNMKEVPPWIDSSTAEALLPPCLEAARALSQTGPMGEEELLKAAKNENTFIRRNGVFGLGNSFSESCRKAVNEALHDPHPSVRQAALGSLNVANALPYLLSALKDSDHTVRSAAVLLLGKLNDRGVQASLLPLVKDNHPEVRRKVAEAYGSLGGAEALDPLKILSEDKDKSVRAEAIKALGRVKNGNAVTALIKALKDQSTEVRAEAVEALGVLRDSRAIPPLYAATKDKDERVRKKALAAVKQLTDIPMLIAALDDESIDVRKNAAYVLWLMTGMAFGADKDKWEKWKAQNNSTKQQ